MSLQEPSITFSAFVPSVGNGFMVILYAPRAVAMMPVVLLMTAKLYA